MYHTCQYKAIQQTRHIDCAFTFRTTRIEIFASKNSPHPNQLIFICLLNLLQPLPQLTPLKVTPFFGDIKVTSDLQHISFYFVIQKLKHFSLSSLFSQISVHSCHFLCFFLLKLTISFFCHFVCLAASANLYACMCAFFL